MTALCLLIVRCIVKMLCSFIYKLSCLRLNGFRNCISHRFAYRISYSVSYCSFHVCLMYSGKTDENLRKFLEESGELLPAGYSVSCMGSVVGTHVGPGAVAVAYFRKS